MFVFLDSLFPDSPLSPPLPQGTYLLPKYAKGGETPLPAFLSPHLNLFKMHTIDKFSSTFIWFECAYILGLFYFTSLSHVYSKYPHWNVKSSRTGTASLIPVALSSAISLGEWLSVCWDFLTSLAWPTLKSGEMVSLTSRLQTQLNRMGQHPFWKDQWFKLWVLSNLINLHCHLP